MQMHGKQGTCAHTRALTCVHHTHTTPHADTHAPATLSITTDRFAAQLFGSGFHPKAIEMVPTDRWLAAMAAPLNAEYWAEADHELALLDPDWGDAEFPDLPIGPERLAHIVSATVGLYMVEDDNEEDLANDIDYHVVWNGLYIMRLMHIRDWPLGVIRDFLRHVGLQVQLEYEIKSAAELMHNTRTCKKSYADVVHAGLTVGRVVPQEAFRLILDFLHYPRGYSDVVHAGLTLQRAVPPVPFAIILDCLQQPRCGFTARRLYDRFRRRTHGRHSIEYGDL